MQKEFYIGHTHIIMDDSCCVPPAERAKIMQRVSNTLYQGLLLKEEEERKKNESIGVS